MCARPVLQLPEVEVVDTPGVGALDGAEDFTTAFAEVPTADVVIWVASNNSLQEETARALRLLGLYGKPVLVVLNCRWDLGHPLKRIDFLEHPELAFRDVDGDVNAIRRQLARVGALPTAVIAIHANAAFESTQPSAERQTLRANSGIDDLYAALRFERDQRAEQRRALRLVDAYRTPGVAYMAELRRAIAQLTLLIRNTAGVQQDMRQRLAREIDRHDELLAAELHELVVRRRGWHATVDVSKDIKASWVAELASLRSEVESAVARNGSQLSRALKDTGNRVVADWDMLPMEKLDLGEFTGFGSVWINRLGRAGLGVGGGLGGLAAGAALGAQIGAGLGLVGGPLAVVTTVTGAVVGAAGSLLAKPLQDLVTKVFHGQAEVIRRRQEELRRSVHPVLDGVEESLRQSRAENNRRRHEVLNGGFDHIDAALGALEFVRDQWRGLGHDLQLAVDRLDLATAKTILSLARRPRLAGAVRRAMRVPGVATAVELTTAGFAEGALFPADGACEAILPCGPAKPLFPGGQSLPLLLALWQGPVQPISLTPDRVHVELIGDPAPAGVTATWADLLRAFTGSNVQITTPWISDTTTFDTEDTR